MTRYIPLVTVIIALVIIADYSLPGVKHTEAVSAIRGERQEYNNAARNSHLSYQVVTESLAFDVSAALAKQVSHGDKVTYYLSHTFGEVNRHGPADSGELQVHSLRSVSGLYLPLVVLLILALSKTYGERLEILAFVAKVVLVADVIYLLL